MVRQYFIVAFLSFLFTSCSGFRHQQKEPEKKTAVSSASLQGIWVLDYVLADADMPALYPDRKPELLLPVAGGDFQGSSGCNQISGKLIVEGRKMTFADPVALTRMMCPGGGEKAFLDALKRVNTYALSTKGDELTCIQGDIVVMRFLKK